MRSVNDRHSSFPDGRAHLGQYCLKAQKDTVLLYELYPPKKNGLCHSVSALKYIYLLLFRFILSLSCRSFLTYLRICYDGPERKDSIRYERKKG